MRIIDTPKRLLRAGVLVAIMAVFVPGAVSGASGIATSSELDPVGVVSPSETFATLFSEEEVPTLGATVPVAASPLTDNTVHLASTFSSSDGSVESEGVRYDYTIADGEATIVRISKAEGNEKQTYVAVVPESIESYGKSYLVTAIGDNVMGTEVNYWPGTVCSTTENHEIVGLVLPSKLLTVGKAAFSGCTELASVKFAADADGLRYLESIDSFAFYKTAVESLDLPDTLTSVGDYAFREISGLHSLTLPCGSTSWGTGTFYLTSASDELVIPEGCISAPALTTGAQSISIPASLSGTVEVYAKNATSVTFGSPSQCSTLKLEYGQVEELDVPDGVQNLYLKGSSNHVGLPGTLKVMTSFNVNGVEELDIPSSVTTISGLAFTNNTTLRSVRIPSSVGLTIGSYAFSLCSALETIEMGEGVVSLCGNAFSNCDALREVTIPASVRGSFADVFNSCDSLQSILFAYGSNITEVSRIARDCPALVTVALPDNPALSVRRIADWDCLLSGCPALERILTYNPDLVLQDSDFVDCGSFDVYGWATVGSVVDFAESAGHDFVPYAELDAQGYNGSSNVSLEARADGTLGVSCSFSSPGSYDYARVLEQGTDYEVSVGTISGLSCLTAIGDDVTCFGSANVWARQSLEGATMAAVPTQLLMGSPCEPHPQVTLGEEVLREGVDYTLSYVGNDSAGTATVTVTGAGSFTGSVSVSFEVKEYVENEFTSRTSAFEVSCAGVSRAQSAIVVWTYDDMSAAVAAPLSAATGAPVVGVSSDGLSESQLQMITSWGAEDALVIGGPDGFADALRTQLAAVGIAYEAVEESGLQATSVAVASRDVFWNHGCVVANPSEPGLLLAASAYASAARVPLLLTDPDGTLDAAASTLAASSGSAVVVGGYASVDASIDVVLANSVRIAGNDAVQTSLLLAERGYANDLYTEESGCVYVGSSSAAPSLMAYAAVAGASSCPFVLCDDDPAMPAALIRAHVKSIETLTALRCRGDEISSTLLALREAML